MSKVIERMVTQQVTDYLQCNNLLPELQSAYRRNHSTETALLCVVSDLLRAIDVGSVTLLGLLDLSAAFETVDRDILLRRLDLNFGIGGTAMTWVTSFINNRTQEVLFAGKRSATCRVLSGVPQGSVLGPLLFLVYAAALFAIIDRHGFKAYSYADETQIYMSLSAVAAQDAVSRFAACVSDVERWTNSTA